MSDVGGRRNWQMLMTLILLNCGQSKVTEIAKVKHRYVVGSAAGLSSSVPFQSSGQPDEEINTVSTYQRSEVGWI